MTAEHIGNRSHPFRGIERLGASISWMAASLMIVVAIVLAGLIVRNATIMADSDRRHARLLATADRLKNDDTVKRWWDEQHTILRPIGETERWVRDAGARAGVQIARIDVQPTDRGLAAVNIVLNAPASGAVAMLHALESGPLIARTSQLDMRASPAAFGQPTQEKVDVQLTLRIVVRPAEARP